MALVFQVASSQAPSLQSFTWTLTLEIASFLSGHQLEISSPWLIVRAACSRDFVLFRQAFSAKLIPAIGYWGMQRNLNDKLYVVSFGDFVPVGDFKESNENGFNPIPTSTMCRG